MIFHNDRSIYVSGSSKTQTLCHVAKTEKNGLKDRIREYTKLEHMLLSSHV